MVSYHIHHRTETLMDLSWNLCISENSSEKTLLKTAQFSSRVEVDKPNRNFRTWQAHMGHPMFPNGFVPHLIELCMQSTSASVQD